MAVLIQRGTIRVFGLKPLPELIMPDGWKLAKVRQRNNEFARVILRNDSTRQVAVALVGVDGSLRFVGENGREK